MNCKWKRRSAPCPGAPCVLKPRILSTFGPVGTVSNTEGLWRIKKKKEKKNHNKTTKTERKEKKNSLYRIYIRKLDTS